MMDMVERVARAICIADGQDPDHESADPFDEGAKLWTTNIGVARAAIEAMREPVEGMEIAGHDASEKAGGFVSHKPFVTAGWNAMIDAALK
jgi:hypothetical protein